MLRIRLAVAALLALTAVGSTAVAANAAGGPSPMFTANVATCGFDPFYGAQIGHDHHAPVLITEYGVPVQLTEPQWRRIFRQDPYGYFRLTFVPPADPTNPTDFDTLEGGERLAYGLSPAQWQACYEATDGQFLTIGRR